MVPRMGPMSPVRVHSLWAGLRPEKQANKSNDDVTKYVFPFSASSPPFVMETVCRFLTENLPTDRMKNKISCQYFRVLPIRCVSGEDVFAMILYDAS